MNRVRSSNPGFRETAHRSQIQTECASSSLWLGGMFIVSWKCNVIQSVEWFSVVINRGVLIVLTEKQRRSACRRSKPVVHWAMSWQCWPDCPLRHDDVNNSPTFPSGDYRGLVSSVEGSSNTDGERLGLQKQNFFPDRNRDNGLQIHHLRLLGGGGC